MLGLSPDKRGELDEKDVQILTAFGKDLKMLFGGNIIENSGTISEKGLGQEKELDVLRTNNAEFWSFSEKRPAELHIKFDKEEMFDKVVLQENIANGQRIEAFSVFCLTEKNKWKSLYNGGTVGYKRICPIAPVKCRELKIIIEKFRDCFELSYIQIN